MSQKRSELQKTLCQYSTETLTYIVAVRNFCRMFSEWKNCREKEVKTIRDIKEKADEIDPPSSKSEGKETSSQKPATTLEIKSVAELENLLREVLKETLKGLKELKTFLDAVEKLAVTSLQVFNENKILFLSDEISFDEVQDLIKSARQICPLLLEFKRDPTAFFVPTRHNVEVLLYQLEKHVNTSKRIFENLSDSLNIDICQEITKNIAVECDLSDDVMQKMTDQVKQLDIIRKDDDFRMMFLFQRISYSEFVKKYKDEHPKMLQLLDQIEQCAVQLDSTNKRAMMSSVTGSSVGAVGKILSIVGLILIPFKPDVSMKLITAGAAAGTSSEANSLVATVEQNVVYQTQTQQANRVFQRFMSGVQRIQNCLEEAAKPPSREYVLHMVDEIDLNSRVIEKAADLIEYVVTNAAKVALQEGKAERNVTNVASDVPEISQAAVKGPLSLSESERYGSIAKNVFLFLGMDIFFITTDSKALAEGTESKVSKFLRARAALWLSEILAWRKICNSLSSSELTTEENKEMLEKPFYPV